MLEIIILMLIKSPLPPSTTPPTPRAPPAGLFASSPAPLNEGTVERGDLLPVITAVDGDADLKRLFEEAAAHL